MVIHKIDSGLISMAQLISRSAAGDVVESSRVHVGSTTASLPIFAATQDTNIVHMFSDLTFDDNDYGPHEFRGTTGRVTIADGSIITYMSKATAMPPVIAGYPLSVGDSVSEWHMGTLTSVFPSLRTVHVSALIRANAEMIVDIVRGSWDLIAKNEEFKFRHYIEADGKVSVRKAPDSVDEVLADLALIDGRLSGWKLPNIVIVLLNIIMGSKNQKEYYHLCGPAMYRYIDRYQSYIEVILEKIGRFGRSMLLVNTAPFRVFALRGDETLLDSAWSLWQRLRYEPRERQKVLIGDQLAELVRSKRMPWYERCESKTDMTHHDFTVGTGGRIVVPTWALHASFEELSRFVDHTVSLWKSRKKTPNAS